MTFLPDGAIGEGRNENEYRWVFEGNLLVPQHPALLQDRAPDGALAAGGRSRAVEV